MLAKFCDLVQIFESNQLISNLLREFFDCINLKYAEINIAYNSNALICVKIKQCPHLLKLDSTLIKTVLYF